MAMVPSAYIANTISSLEDLINSKITKVLGITNEVKKLVHRLEKVLDVLEDAERKKIVDGDVKRWLVELQEVVFELHKVIDYCRIEADNTRKKEKQTQPQVVAIPRLLASCFNKFGLRDEISKRISTLNLKMKSILKEKAELKLEKVSINKTYTAAPTEISFQSLPSNTFIGSTIEADTNCLVHILTKEETHEEEGSSHSLIAIVGVSGIGKTTLARKIFNDERIRGSFDIRIWISLSVSLKDTTLLAKIIDAAGGNPGKSTSRAHLKPKLAATITGKRFLIVFDDVSDSKIWENLLKAPLKTGAKGSRVMVTTREENIAVQMGATHVHDVKRLSAEEGWLLLRESFSLEDEDETDILVDIGLKISKRCDGLPLAIKTVGGILKRKTPTIKDMRTVSESQTWSNEGLPKWIPRALYLGYEDLPLNLKQCFLYCSLFPRNFCFNRRDLIKQWVSEGFLVKRDGSTLEEIGEEYYQELVERYLISPEPECDNTERCKMHDCLVNMARLLFADEILVDESSKLVELTFRLHHASLASKGMEIIPKEIITKEKLRTLLLSKNALKDEGLRDIFTRFKVLQVLDISETSIEVIPNMLQNLLHLRYLNLSRTKIKELPESIKFLRFLQFLLLQECRKLHSLPKWIEHLKSLRSLDITGTIINRFLFKIGELVNLNSLDFFIVNTKLEQQEEKDGWPLSELKSLSKLRWLCILQIDKTRDLNEAKEALLGAKRCLKQLELNCSNEAAPSEDPIKIQKVEDTFDELFPPPCLEILKIVNYFGTKYPSWLSSVDLLSNLQQLELINCQFCQTLPPLGQLPQLQFLSIANAPSLKDIEPDVIVTGQEVAFPKLKKLHMQNLHKLESWSGLERPGSMPCLEAFQLESCPGIRYLPSFMKHSKHLKELRIIDCKSLELIENLTTIKELSVWNTPNMMKISNLTLLEDLSISHSSNLQIIENVSSLKYVQIFDYDLEATPRWLKDCASHIQYLDLAGREEMLKRCFISGPDWNIIQDISHMYGHSNSCTYFLYNKNPFSFETNISVLAPQQKDNSTVAQSVVMETILEEIPESFSTEENLIIDEIGTKTKNKKASDSRSLHHDHHSISVSPISIVEGTQGIFSTEDNQTNDEICINMRSTENPDSRTPHHDTPTISINPIPILEETQKSYTTEEIISTDMRSKETSDSKPLHHDLPTISLNSISPAPTSIISDNILGNSSKNTFSFSNLDIDTIGTTTSSLVRRRRKKGNIIENKLTDVDNNASTGKSMPSNLMFNFDSGKLNNESATEDTSFPKLEKTVSHKSKNNANQNTIASLLSDLNSPGNSNTLSSKVATSKHIRTENAIKKSRGTCASNLFYNHSVKSGTETLSHKNLEKQENQKTNLNFGSGSDLEAELEQFQRPSNFHSTLERVRSTVEGTNHFFATVKGTKNAAVKHVGGIHQSQNIEEDDYVKKPIEKLSIHKSEVSDKLWNKERLKEYLIVILLAVSIMQAFLIIWLVLWFMKEMKANQ